MILNCADYAGPCACGRSHELETKLVVVDYGCLRDFEAYMDSCGLSGRRTVIYDTNTYAIPGLTHVAATKEIVLESEGLAAEKDKIEAIIPRLDSPDVLVAVGSGTIMDFARYNAHKLGLPFVSIPTVASADGYTANICSVVIDGQKKSLTLSAPTLVVADLDVISSAPWRLNLSGVSDILSKYVSLADWRIAHIVGGEYYCEATAKVAGRGLSMMAKCAADMRAGAEPDFMAMTMAHMYSGLSMQLLNSSRAASGSEHLVAHLVEMKPPRFEGAAGLHGECVGVGTILAAELYHQLAASEPKVKAFVPIDPAWVAEKFGPLAEGIFRENESDCLESFKPEAIRDNWDAVREVVGTIPKAEDLRTLFASLGMKTKLSDIGIDEGLAPEIMDIASAIRNRLTLARMRRLMDLGG